MCVRYVQSWREVYMCLSLYVNTHTQGLQLVRKLYLHHLTHPLCYRAGQRSMCLYKWARQYKQLNWNGWSQEIHRGRMMFPGGVQDSIKCISAKSLTYATLFSLVYGSFRRGNTHLLLSFLWNCIREITGYYQDKKIIAF